MIPTIAVLTTLAVVVLDTFTDWTQHLSGLLGRTRERVSSRAEIR